MNPGHFPFPLVRRLSAPLTPWLLRTPLTANQATTSSMLLGLAGAALFATGTGRLEWLAALAIVACYVLDNCDGEIARNRQQASAFGAFYDTLVDWLVHSAFFVGLGIGRTAQTGEALWVWLGGAAAVGGTINYLLGLHLDSRAPCPAGDALGPCNAGEWLLFGFRELARADFCFIVLVLAFFNWTWVLLPAAAVGAQVYWLTRFGDAARRFHV